MLLETTEKTISKLSLKASKHSTIKILLNKRMQLISTNLSTMKSNV